MKDCLDDNLCVPVPEKGAATTLDADFPPPSEDGEDVGEGMDLVFQDIWWV